MLYQRCLLVAMALGAAWMMPASVKADFASEYKNAESANWEDAQFVNIGKNLKGDTLEERYKVNKNGDIYKFTNYSKDASKYGNLREQEQYSRNTCFFGYNPTCASNTMTTVSQYAIEDCKLYKYSKTRMISGGTFGDVERTLLGECRDGFAQKR